MGVLQKKRDSDGKWERTKLEVPFPAQTWDYCNTFHLINKGNEVDTNYDLRWESGLHNWAPKFIFRLSNMSINNAYKMYKALVKQHMPERRFLDMGNAMRELAHNLCQMGLVMRKLRAEHPSWTWDMLKLFRWKAGRKVCSDAMGMMTVALVMLQVQEPMVNYVQLKNQQCRSLWHVHQSKAVAQCGKCYWEDFPVKKISTAKCPRSSNTHMHCKESSAYLGKDVFLCNGFVRGVPVNCHHHYHIYHYNKEFASTMVIN